MGKKRMKKNQKEGKLFLRKRECEMHGSGKRGKVWLMADTRVPALLSVACNCFIAFSHFSSYFLLPLFSLLYFKIKYTLFLHSYIAIVKIRNVGIIFFFLPFDSYHNF